MHTDIHVLVSDINRHDYLHVQCLIVLNFYCFYRGLRGFTVNKNYVDLHLSVLLHLEAILHPSALFFIYNVCILNEIASLD